MTKTRSPFTSNMQHHKGPGWAAFDCMQRGIQGTVTEHNVDHYPSVSKTTTSSSDGLTKNNTTIRSFSSIICPPVGFAPIACNHDSEVTNDMSHANKQINQVHKELVSSPVEMLKDIHDWADQTLIEDVLAGVNNDVDQALLLLEAMILPDESKLADSSLSAPISSTLIGVCEDKNNLLGKCSYTANKTSDSPHEELVSKSFVVVPVESEWEEDDIYLSHRKDAVRMMRLAAQHARAASNAYMRGDHISAREYSSRAHDERLAGEKLSAAAAKEILHIRNSNNDIWKLDLHGLHASEAVSALKEQLQKLESEIILKRLASADALTEVEVGSSSSGICRRVNRETNKKGVSQQGPKILHVITGMGNHSRGQAALPTAIKSFLIENGYRFDDARPGVFAVRPKFRYK